MIWSLDAIDWIDSPALLEETVARVRDVRALGLDVGIDFHGRLHKGMAKQLAKLLEPLHPLFIEGRNLLHITIEAVSNENVFVEPLLPTQPEEIADLNQIISTPIALGERLYGRTDFRPYLERRAMDIAQPDVRCLQPNDTHTLLDTHCNLGFPLWRY